MDLINKLDKEQNKAKIGLSKSQKEGLDYLVKWFNDPNDLVCTLYGAAGTGKTYLLKRFLDNYVKYGISVTAPTHKAVSVIEASTGRKGKTFQSLHGLRPNYNLEQFNIDNFQFDTLGKPLIQSYRLVVVDECSQISYDLDRLNRTRAKQFIVKILYVGDILQLPPITTRKNQRLSPVFNNPTRFELIEIIRQKGDNPLLEVLSLLRDDVKNESSKFLTLLKKKSYSLNEKDEGYISLNLKDFKISLYRRFKDQKYKTNSDYVKYTSWRNKNISSWNKYLRTVLFNNPADAIIKDDLLLGYNTIIDPDNFMESIITNSINYTITGITKRRSDRGFDIYVIDIKNNKTIKTIFVVDHESTTFRTFYSILSNLHRKALFAQPYQKSSYWTEYYSFKNKYLTMIDFNIIDQSDNIKRGKVKKDLDYGYGMTVHKL